MRCPLVTRHRGAAFSRRSHDCLQAEECNLKGALLQGLPRASAGVQTNASVASAAGDLETSPRQNMGTGSLWARLEGTAGVIHSMLLL